jgi:prevent-host-death family protein
MGIIMRTASLAEVKAHFSDFIKESERGPVVVTRRGKPIVVLLAVDDEGEVERRMMSRSRPLQSLLNAARQRLRQGQGIPENEFWEDVKRSSAKQPRLRKPSVKKRK